MHPVRTLLANDSTGPANESGQTLTITPSAARSAARSPSAGTDVELHAGRRLQRPRQLHLHHHRQRHDQRRSPTPRPARPPSRSPSPRSTTPRRRRRPRQRGRGRRGRSRSRPAGQRQQGPGQRVRPDADHHRGDAAPAHGTRQPSSARGHSTRPAADYNGPDSFTYTITDDGTTNGVADPKTDTATVTFTVTEVNDAPTAVNDTRRRGRGSASDHPVRDLLGQRQHGPGQRGRPDPDRHRRRPNARRRHGRPSPARTSPTRRTPTTTAPHSFTYTVTDNGTTNGSRRLQDRHGHRQRHRHRGQRRPDGQRPTRTTVAEDGTLTFPASDLTGQRLSRPGQREPARR